MRQWNVNPKFLCNQHLLGEHVEHHMFLGSLKKNKSVKGFIETGLFETHKLKIRHDELVEEMKLRGMNHKSPLDISGIVLVQEGKVDIEKNIKELSKRCEKCKHNIESYLLSKV